MFCRCKNESDIITYLCKEFKHSNQTLFLIKSLFKIFLFLSSLSVFSQTELKADFDVINKNGCVPFVAEFIDVSSGGSSWDWDFGNGVSSNEQNPIHVYAEPGFYTISLTVSDSNSSHTETKSALIRVNPSPFADFTVNNQLGCSPHEVQFTDLSIPTSGTITDWFWSFGNGITSNQQNPSTSYTEIKDFSVFLKITDINGCQASLSKSNYVKLDGPEAKFIFDSVVCGIPSNVTFLNQSIGNDLEYLWDFGDGTILTGDVPGTHTYQAFDSTKVTLIITESKTGCADTLSNSIVVGNYEAEFDWDIICNEDEFTINVENKTRIYNSLEWDFSGESKAYTSNASHEFSGKGPYEITLKSSIDLSCWDTTTIKYNLPIPNISYTADICSYPFEVTFENQSKAKNFDSFWDFGDSTFSSDKNPKHTYTIPPEAFLSKLIIRDSFGCTDSAYKNITVPFPIARFFEINSIYSGCAPLNLTFKDTSYILNSTVSSVIWDFGDPSSGSNNFSTENTPTHVYNEPGNYDIKYIIFTNNGCSDTANYEAIIQVGEKPLNASFEQVVSDSICYGESIQFIESVNYATNFIESNYYCWAFEKNQDSLLSDPESPPIECPKTPEYSNTNKPFINFSEPYHLYSEFKHIADTNLPKVSTGKILPNAGDLFTHLIIGYNNCFTEVIRPTFVDTTIAINGFVRNDSIELFSDSTIQIGLYQASLNYDSIPYSYVYVNSATDTLLQIHVTDTNYHEFKEGNTYKIRTRVLNQESGCSNEITDIFPVDSVRINFNIVDQKCLNENPVLFADYSYAKFGNLYSRKWLVNDNIVRSGKSTNKVDSFYYSFPDTGLFNVRLELMYSIQYKKYGEWKIGYYTKSLDKKIKIQGIKAIGYTDTLQICSGHELKFTNASKSTTLIQEFKWLFGDKTDSSSLESPNHNYISAGSFSPILVATDTFGCIDSFFLNEIEVFKPIVKFEVSDSLICKGDILAIENKSIGNSLSFTWSIDSLTQYSRSINQQFNSAGFYDVKLHAIDTLNCVDSLIKLNHIEVSEIPNAKFAADIFNKECPPLVSTFFDTTESSVEEWLWDFGDGNSRTDKNPTHIFTKSGTYDISLIVTNHANCRDTILKTKHIEVGGPSGQISFDKDTLCIPESVTFNLNLNKTKYYIIGFGDENTISFNYSDNSDSIVHQYQKGGIYHPIIELIDSLGCIYKLSDLPKIYGDSIDAKFQLNSPVICDLKNIQFQNNSNSTFDSKYSWSFGNNDSSIAKSPVYNYSKDSTYEITLQQTSPLGCIDSVKDKITVFKSPSPSISIQNKNYCIPSETKLELTFEKNEFKADRISYSINENVSKEGNSITNIFTTEGNQKIKYTIEYGNGNCILDTNIQLFFYKWPKANFDYSPSNISVEEPVVFFKDKSENTTQWNWDFGDLESSQTQSPAHNYEIENIYTVQLIASNLGECSDSITREISISPYDFFKLPSGFSPNQDGRNETFRILSAGNIELIEFKIFNRWGNLVFKTSNIEEAWDGKRRGEDQNAGTYIYYIKGRKRSGEITEIKGNLTLLR